MAKRSAVTIAVRKKAEELRGNIQRRFIYNLEEQHIPEIENLILVEYDVELTGRVTDRRAKTNPTYYREEFQEALRMYEYITTKLGRITLSTPETETFNWNQGRLRIIENIVEGTIGKYIEVNEEQYIAMFGKRPIIQPFDRAVPIRERIYLLRHTSNVKNKWRTAYPGLQPVDYPFSNQPPVDIFDTANKFVDENLQSWIDKAIKDSQKEISK